MTPGDPIQVNGCDWHSVHRRAARVSLRDDADKQVEG